MRWWAPVVIGLLASACTLPVSSGGSEPTPPAGPASTAATAPPSTPPPSAGYETTSCQSSPPVAFAVLCEAYSDIVDRHVDPADADGLAAAAVLGITDVPDDPDGDPPPERLQCAIPDPAFERLCEAVWQRIGEGPVGLDAVMEGAVRGMFRYGLDPFSSYIPDSEVDFDPTGAVLQLGMTIGARDETGDVCSPIGGACALVVLSVFDFGPAEEAGLAAGDRLVQVGETAVDGLGGDEAVALLAGEPGTSVDVVAERDGVATSRTLVRAEMWAAPTEWELVDDVAVIGLNDFSQPAAQDLGAILQLDEVEGASGIVLDLRDNPGGLVVAAQAVASQFLDGGDVLVERGREVDFTVPVVPGGLAVDGPPLVVVVNRGSASAAEIVAAVLQERRRALVVGEPTFGKNLVQEVSASRDGGQIRLTVARWETPGGRDIGYSGLVPDVEVVADGPGDPVLDSALDMLGG